MRKFGFVGGRRLVLDGRLITLKTSAEVDGAEVWEVFDEVTLQHRRESLHDLQAALVAGRLTQYVDPVGTPGGPVPSRRGARLLSDLSPQAQARVRFERTVLREVARRLPKGQRCAKVERDGKVATALDFLLLELGATLAPKILNKPKEKLSKATFYRWEKKHSVEVDPDRVSGGWDRRGRRDRLGVGVRELVLRTMERVVEEGKGKRAAPGKRRLSMQEVKEACIDDFDRFKAENPNAVLKFPERTLFYELWNLVDRHDRDLAMFGRVLTDKDYRRPGNGDRATYPLQRVQFDETRLPIFLIDERWNVPLGRPWLAWMVDEYSDAFVGWTLGFEPPSAALIASTLKHACLPKTYMKERYPMIKNDVPMAGIPKCIMFDNSLAAHGNSIAEICNDLDIEYEFHPRKKPWHKSQVEGAFGRLEASLLRDKAGYAFPREWNVDRSDYDPQKTACMSFGHFLAILHAWIADYMHVRRPQSRPPKAAPLHRWKEGVARVVPDFVSDRRDLDALFGIVQEARRLDNRGVFFEGVAYYSDPVHKQRLFKGPVQKVAIKVNPLDLTRIHVRASDNSWIAATPTKKAYLDRMDLHLLKLLGKQANLLYGTSTFEDRIRALKHVNSLLGEGFADGMTAANAARAARAMQIGSQFLLRDLPDVKASNLLGHDGPDLQAEAEVIEEAGTPEVTWPATIQSHLVAGPEAPRLLPKGHGSEPTRNPGIVPTIVIDDSFEI